MESKQYNSISIEYTLSALECAYLDYLDILLAFEIKQYIQIVYAVYIASYILD